MLSMPIKSCAVMEFILGKYTDLSFKQLHIENAISKNDQTDKENKKMMIELMQRRKKQLDYIDCNYFNFTLEKAHKKIIQQLRTYQHVSNKITKYAETIRKYYMLSIKKQFWLDKDADRKLLQYRHELLNKLHHAYTLKSHNSRMICNAKQFLIKIKQMEINVHCV